MPKRSYDEIFEAIVTVTTANRLAIQLLVMTLAEKGALDPGDYEQMLVAYLDSPLAQGPDQEGANAFIADLLDSLTDDDGLDG